MTGYTNPIIPGFHPDPSACRVGDDYYLVTSSFEFFPGVPIFHSKDLVHWRKIGHCLTRASQLRLDHAGPSGGIYAPTIRQRADRFYMVTTNVSDGGNFYVTAADPAGPWSEPIWVEQGGIDPSLLFDSDGKVYFSSTGNEGIQQSEIDIETGKLITGPRSIWRGTGGRYPEGPHLYRVDGNYYLLISEGGTEYGHMVTMARSTSPWGPFEPCPRNPILSHRDRGAHPVQGTGHAELLHAHDGSWWLVFLAFRPLAQVVMPAHHLGRETFLAPVAWRDGWPVVSPGSSIEGSVELEMNVPTLPIHPWPAEPVRDHFDAAELGASWAFLRNPAERDYSLIERPGWLRLKGATLGLDDLGSPTWVGRRQQHFRMTATALVEFDPSADSEEAGIGVYHDPLHHYEIAITRRDGGRVVIVRRRIGDLSAVVAQRPLEPGAVRLSIDASEYKYVFRVGGDCGELSELAQGDTRYLSTEVAGGFIGVFVAMYATGNGAPARAAADFDWFDYELPRN
jgi:alpha-N-arabinofuranosidase